MGTQVADPQPAKRPDPAPGRDQGAEHGPVPKAHGGVELNSGEQPPGLRQADLRSLAVDDLVLDPPDRVKGIEHDGVAGHQRVEKMPERREGLVLGGSRDGKVAQEAAGQAGRDVGELQVLALAELEKPPDGPAVGPARLRIGDPGREELVRRKAGGRAGALQHRRERRRSDVAADGLERGEVGQRVGHNHLR